MENPDPSNRSKRTVHRSSDSHMSMSDAESTTSRAESWYSPLRSESPLRFEDPNFQQENDKLSNKNSKALVSVDKTFYHPAPSPGKSNVQASSPAAGAKSWRQQPHSEKHASGNVDFPGSPTAKGRKAGRREKQVAEDHDLTSPVDLGLNRLVRDEPSSVVKKVEPAAGGGLEEGYGDGGDDGVGGERQSRAAVASILRRSERSAAVRRAALMFRASEVIFCLISFSVMVADKTRGWAGDSYDRYKEYRYCVAVNVIGFVYSGFQAYDLAYHLGTGKRMISHNLRYHLDFSMDQILAYFLLSASSSAATRVTDWISNWGKDEFTSMASASIAMSFLGFVSFAFSSLISGYNLCNRDSA